MSAQTEPDVAIKRRGGSLEKAGGAKKKKTRKEATLEDSDSADEGSLCEFIVPDDAQNSDDDPAFSAASDTDSDDDDNKSEHDESEHDESEDEDVSDAELHDGKIRVSKDIDVANIISGRRTRRPPTRFVDEMMRDNADLILNDIESDELYAALEDSDLSHDEDSDDESEDSDDESYSNTDESSSDESPDDVDHVNATKSTDLSAHVPDVVQTTACENVACNKI